MAGATNLAPGGARRRPRSRPRKRFYGAAVGGVLAAAALLGDSRWPLRGPPDVLPIVAGYALVAFAVGFRVWASLFIAGYKQVRLATEGSYALCRNPLYLGTLLALLGLALTTRTVTFPLLVLAGFLAYYPSVLAREEAKLARLFGPAYERWRRGTPALLPRRLRFVHPPACTVDPGAVVRQAFDALRVVAALGLLEATDALHRAGWLPTWLHFY